MNYPMMDHCLTFKRKDRKTVEVKNNILKMSWEMDVNTACFLRALDGSTNPYTIDPNMSRREVDELMETLEEEWLLDDGERIVHLGMGSVLIPLWRPKVTRWDRFLALIWNKALMLFWIPTFALGVRILLDRNWNGVGGRFGLLQGCLLFIVGMFLREISHAAACLSYGGHFYEMGIMTHCFLPGAYVMITYDNVRNRFRRAQISAAGIEGNLLLTGICLCLLKAGFFNSVGLLAGALLNVITAVFNCALLEQMDGMGICGEFLGEEDFVSKAKKLIWDEDGKAILRYRGINGRITIMACYLIVLMQMLLPIVLAMNVFSIVSVFI